MVKALEKFRVFIPEPEYPETLEMFKDFAEVVIGEPGVKYDESKLAEILKDFDAVIITSQHRKVSRYVISKSPRLKVIAKYGAKPGVDNVDIEAATERGIPVVYSPEANSDSVAEFTVMLMLCTLKRLCFLEQFLRSGGWRDALIKNNALGYELKDKTVGIIGLGSIGRRVARILQAFGAKLMGYDPYIPPEALANINITLVKSLDELLKESDVVTIHALLTPQTHHLIGERELTLMKPSAYIINTARGAIVDEAALVKALREKRIAGAALDVFETEPLPKDHPLLQLSNVIITPHFAGFTYEALRKETSMAHEDVIRVLKGCRPKYLANPEVLSKRPDLCEC
ncbi:MAG: hydroxyacid dehydrogenase [Zestosphaera sp.]